LSERYEEHVFPALRRITGNRFVLSEENIPANPAEAPEGEPAGTGSQGEEEQR
jgi:hypothetical protein